MTHTLIKRISLPFIAAGLLVACGGLNNEDDPTTTLENKRQTSKKSGNESFKNNRRKSLRLSSGQKAKEQQKKDSTENSKSTVSAEQSSQEDAKHLREYVIDLCTERAAEILRESLESKGSNDPKDPEPSDFAYEKSLDSAYALADSLTGSKAIFDKLDAAYDAGLAMKGTDKKSVSQCVETIHKAEVEAEKAMAAQENAIDKQWEKHEKVLNEIFDATDKVYEECEIFLVEEILNEEGEVIEEDELLYAEVDPSEDPDEEHFDDIEFMEENYDEDEIEEFLAELKDVANSKECKDASAALDAVVKKHSQVTP